MSSGPARTRRAFVDGAIAVAPILLGVIPFGLVYGAAAVDAGLSVAETQGFSVFLFAGASQLAAVDLLAGGATWYVAVLTAWVINLRMLMYGASLAPYFSDVRLRDRLGAAYLLTDQAYAVSVTRFGADGDRTPRLPFYLGAAIALWATWQTTTFVGALAGQGIPDDVPLDFAIPLVFLALLVPALRDRPAVYAAAVSGLVAVAVAEVGAGDVAIFVGALAGIVAGVTAERRGAV